MLPYILESVDKESSNYLESNTGLSYIRVYDQQGIVAFSENDIVNNSMMGYGNANCSLKKVESLIIAIDVLVDLIYSF